MSAKEPTPLDDLVAPFPGWRTLAVVTLLYFIGFSVATYPLILNLGSRTGDVCDNLHVLWAMRWYKSCLFEVKSPFFTADIQYPVGVPLGFFDPVRFQTLLYVPLSVVLDDVLCLNMLRIIAFLSTGLGTFLLAWYLLRDRACAAFGGLLAMLSTPVVTHSGAHLVLIQLGAVPLFLLAWIRFADRPSRTRLIAAAVLFLLVVISAHYFVVLIVFPAALYVAWLAIHAAREGGIRSWLRERTAWILAFVAVTLPFLLLIFSTHIWVMTHGHSMTRLKSEFAYFKVPPWAYLVPNQSYRVGSWCLPFDAYTLTKLTGESWSYLGIVTLSLLYYAAVNRVRFPRVAYWWSALALLVLLSFGPHWRIGSHKVDLPASWLWQCFPPIRWTRVPARFNLFAVLIAAVIAAAGLRHLLARIRRPALRGTVYGSLLVAAAFDLAPIGYCTASLPAMPTCYGRLLKGNARAAFLEVPVVQSGLATRVSALSAYWQTTHRGRTSGGYSAHGNTEYDNLLVHTSPFSFWRLADPNYLQDPDRESFDLVSRVRFRDQVWMYSTVHRFDYIVLHLRPEMQADLPMPMHLDLLRAQLRNVNIYEHDGTIIYDPARLGPPDRPVVLCTGGWLQRRARRNRNTCAASKSARIAVYNPMPDQELIFAFEAEAFRTTRTVRLLMGEAELGRWEIRPGVMRPFSSPPLHLPAGLHELTIASDGEERPVHRHEAVAEGDMRPYSLRVASVNLRPLEQTPRIARILIR